jgi:hypothetical protein
MVLLIKLKDSCHCARVDASAQLLFTYQSEPRDIIFARVCLKLK